MAAVTLRDERGAVYVEFLLAFLPLFVLFLALCQVSFLIAGKLVVRHAAFAAARSAIVVLDDDPARYRGAARGVLTEGDGNSRTMEEAMPRTGFSSKAEGAALPQRGARMAVIRAAALHPLYVLAPASNVLFRANEASLELAVQGDRASFERLYSMAATVVTLHDSPGSGRLALEPIARDAPVTARVTYLQLCAVPLIRGLLCSSLGSLLDTPLKRDVPRGELLRERLRSAQAPTALQTLADPASRFMVFEAEVTLPNQGALYAYPGEGRDASGS